jgi:thioesterase domain-containing protein
MALQLTAVGEQVSLLAVLDMPTPAVIMRKRDRRQQSAATGSTDDEAISDDLLGRYAGLASVAGDALERHQVIVRRVRMKAISDYQPKLYPGAMVLFRSEESRANLSYFGDEWLGWRTLVGDRLTMHDLPGGHVEILQEPHVRKLAGKLMPYLSRSAQVSSPRIY